MNRKIAWILMIPICIIALYFLLESVMYVPEITGMEGTGLVLFIPIFAIICIVSILNIALYFIITHQHIRLNQLDREILNKVSEKIEQYEENNGITITKLAIVYDRNTKEYEDWVIKTPAYNIRGTASWAARYAIENYTKKDLIHIYPDKDVAISFLNKDWEEFSEEQIYMVNDTLYFCVY